MSKSSKSILQLTLNQGVEVIIIPWDFRRKSGRPALEDIDRENLLYDKIIKRLKDFSKRD